MRRFDNYNLKKVRKYCAYGDILLQKKNKVILIKLERYVQ